MAAVRIEEEAFSDARVELLGTLAGYSRYEALGRLAHLWRVCTQRQTYVLSEAMVNACIGPAGVQHMLDAELAERTDAGVRIKGTSGRIEWIAEFSAKKQRAGQARAAKATRNEKGQLMSSKEPAAAGDAGPAQPAQAQHEASTPPAKPSATTISISISKEEGDTSGKPDPAAEFAEVAVAEINRLARKRYQPASSLKLCQKLVKAKHTPEEAVQVVRSKQKWIGDPKMDEFFRPATLLALANFTKYLDELQATKPLALEAIRPRAEAVSPLMAAFAEEEDVDAAS